MRHSHFKYLRNFIILIIAFVFAGYPYLLVTHYIAPSGIMAVARGIFMFAILVVSFSTVAYLAHVEHKKREKEEQGFQEEPASPRGY